MRGTKFSTAFSRRAIHVERGLRSRAVFSSLLKSSSQKSLIVRLRVSMFDKTFLDTLRKHELQLLVGKLKPGARILEFGAGTGTQARELERLGFDVVAVDLPTSGYAEERVFPVVDYDGSRIPLPDSSVDVIFSSNVLEHVEPLPEILAEFHRTLKPNGYCVHLIPSVAWRAWTFAAGIPNSAIAAWQIFRDLILPPKDLPMRTFRENFKTVAAGVLPLGHGTSFEGISEFWTFSVPCWRMRFRKAGFVMESVHPLGVFHTGHMLAGKRLTVRTRERLAKRIGSAANIFVIRPQPGAHDA